MDKGEKITKQIMVALACIRKGNQVLLTRRLEPELPEVHLKWDLPGGIVEVAEKPEAAIIREVSEEIGVGIKVRELIPYVHSNVWSYPDKKLHSLLVCYECDLVRENPSFRALRGEIREVCWFDIDEIDFRNTIPGTEEFIKRTWQTRYVRLQCIRPEKNQSKFYILSIQPSMLFPLNLVKMWGRIGHAPRVSAESFDTYKSAEDRLAELLHKRLYHQYEVVSTNIPAANDGLGRLVRRQQSTGTGKE